VPDVPTIAETALPGFESVLWGILFAPAATPEAVQAKIFADCVGILNQRDVVERHASLGAQVATSDSPAAAQRKVQAEIVKWTALANSLGLEQAAPG
jgi:tripartite-type tricarboxylate transporter receptor subunit TctC